MRKPRKHWSFYCVACLFVFQVRHCSGFTGCMHGRSTRTILCRQCASHFHLQVVCRPAAGSQEWTTASQSTASRLWRHQHQALQFELAATRPRSRLLLQTEQQQPAPEEQSAVAAQDDTVSVVSVSETLAVQDAAGLQDADTAEVASQAAEQPGVLQYQSGSSPAIDKQKLVDAAATQASQHLSALPGASDTSVQTHDLDTWPLVNPPFQPALHEVRTADWFVHLHHLRSVTRV